MEDKDAEIFPCQDCGKMRSKNQGGTIFTVCESCWEKKYPPDSPRQDGETPTLKEQVRIVLERVNLFFNDREKSIIWLASRNPLLGNVRPFEMLELGRFNKLMQFVNDAEELRS